MTNGGDAAEQVVRLSLEGFEVAARLTGSAAKNVAILLILLSVQKSKPMSQLFKSMPNSTVFRNMWNSLRLL